MTSSNAAERIPAVSIINSKKEKHPQLQAVHRFKELIEKEELFYSMLFELNNEKVH